MTRIRKRGRVDEYSGKHILSFFFWDQGDKIDLMEIKLRGTFLKKRRTNQFWAGV